MPSWTVWELSSIDSQRRSTIGNVSHKIVTVPDVAPTQLGRPCTVTTASAGSLRRYACAHRWRSQ